MFNKVSIQEGVTNPFGLEINYEGYVMATIYEYKCKVIATKITDTNYSFAPSFNEAADSIENSINSIASDGWKLVSIQRIEVVASGYDEQEIGDMFIFERPKTA